jgi:hypothetical protein
MASTSADVAAAAAMASAKLADLSVHAPPLDGFTANADEIIPGLWLGSEIAADDPAFLRAHGITHVLVPAYTGHPHTPPPLHEGQFTYCIWPVMDVRGFPIIHAFPAFVLWIERAMARGGRVGSATAAEGKEETEGTGTGRAGGRGGVLVHCASGVSRSTSVVVAYLMKAQGLSAGDAYALVRSKRPKISEDKFRPQLDLWGELGFSLDGAAAGAAGGGGEGGKGGEEGAGEGSGGAGVASAAAHGAALEELARLYSIRKIQKMKKAISGEMQTVWEEAPREEEEEEEEEMMFGMCHSSSGRQGGFGDATSDDY